MEVSRRAQSIKASSTLAISAKAAELKAQGKDMVTFGSRGQAVLGRQTK